MKPANTGQNTPKAVGPYSPVVRAGQWLFVSGQIPIDPATGELVFTDAAGQTHRVLENIRLLVTAAGLSLRSVVRTTVYLADMADFQAMNEVYREFFSEPYPARSTVQVTRLPRDARIEIDAIAIYADA